MAIKTIYTCDHCKQDVEGRNELTPIFFTIKLEREGIERTPNFGRDVCDDCLSEFGITEDTSSGSYVSNYCKVDNKFFDMIKKFFSRSPIIKSSKKE